MTYEQMTDDEIIEAATAWVADPNDDMSQGLFTRLIALAAIGARVKPRPIEEAPRDGSRFLARTIERPPWSAIHYRWEEAWWHKGSNELTGYFASVSGAIPECFIPLSALPPPQAIGEK